MNKRLILGAFLFSAVMGANAQKAMTPPAGGKAISDELIGIFFEDISSAADGGLYAELIQNGSFEFNLAERDGWGAGTAWQTIRHWSLIRLQRGTHGCPHPSQQPYLYASEHRTHQGVL